MVKESVSSSGSVKKRRKNAGNGDEGEIDIYKVQIMLLKIVIITFFTTYFTESTGL